MFKNLMSKIEKIEMKKIVVCVVSLALVATIACVAVGCKDAKSSDNSSNPSGAVVENDSAAAEDEVIYETVYVDENGNEIEKPDETVYENEENVESETVENEEVVSSEPIVSNSTEPVVSTPVVEVTSEDVSSEIPVVSEPIVETETPSDCVENTPTYPTVKLYQKTTYYGFDGVFILMDEENPSNTINLADYGLGTADETGISYPSEYYDVVTGKSIRFVCHPSVLPVDIMGYVDEVGRGSTPANVVY